MAASKKKLPAKKKEKKEISPKGRAAIQSIMGGKKTAADIIEDVKTFNSDTTRTAGQTLGGLVEIRDEVSMLISALEEGGVEMEDEE